MIKSKDEKQFKNMLNIEKDEIFRQLQKNKESEHDLTSPEIEPEETAQKENMLFKKDRLEDLGQQEMEEIDRAMNKLETGSFGACESCGAEISRERLKAVPWTRYCKRCARSKESNKTTPADAVREGTPSSDLEGLSDEEDLSRAPSDVWIPERED